MKLDTNTPHIEHEWARAFLVELRLRGIAGHHIGAALAEVEAHCAESGESARDAFGDPVAYADALELPVAPEEPAGRRGEQLSSAVGLGGMLTTLAAVGAWQGDGPVEVTTGSVAVLALVLAGAVLLVRHAERMLRAVVEHWWVAMAYAVVPVAVFVGVLLLGRQVVLTVPWAPVLGLGLALLVGSTVLALRSRGWVADPVVGPAAAQGAGTLADSALARVASQVGPWLFPALTALMCLPLLLL